MVTPQTLSFKTAALALGLLFLRERPSRARLVGAAATVAGVALVSLA